VKIIYDVHPRWTSGSPAQVSEAQATRIAMQEAQAAEPRANMQGIVFAWYEQDKTIHIRDLITNEWFAVPLFTWRNFPWARMLPASRAYYQRPR
jgi:hypothetical protein